MFQVGQLVTQKDRLPWEEQPPGVTAPRYGVIYTVRSIEIVGDDAFLLFEELRNPSLQYDNEYGEADWDASEFRPVSSDRLAIFRQHLAPSPTDKVDA